MKFKTSSVNAWRRWLGLSALSAVAVSALVACGGGSDPVPVSNATSDSLPIIRVITFGDSLADSGTFGLKFTVQNAANRAAGYPIFPEIIATRQKVATHCNYYASSGTTFTARTTSGCTNYAIGGGRIITPAAQGGTASPLTVNTQMTAGATATGGRWTTGDLMIIDGGGNDAADLVGAYLGASAGAAGLANYQNFLAQQLDANTRNSLLSQPNGAALAAGAYMQALANTFYTQVWSQTLEKGATRVVLINMPDITLTPRFQAVLAGVAAQGGAAASAQLKGAIQQWIQAFNAQLRTRVGTDTRIGLVDFYAIFTDQVANPSKYGLTNATAAACPVTGRDSQGLPNYDFPGCTDSALNAAPPTGLSANWWQTWLFSDGFHPTPKGHQLMADEIVKVMDARSWK